MPRDPQFKTDGEKIDDLEEQLKALGAALDIANEQREAADRAKIEHWELRKQAERERDEAREQLEETKAEASRLNMEANRTAANIRAADVEYRAERKEREKQIAEALRVQRAEIKQLKEKLTATEGLFRGANSMALRRDARQAEAGRQSMDQSRRAILAEGGAGDEPEE